MSRPAVQLPKKLSPGEECFAMHCRAHKLNPLREYKFHPVRKWRADFCFIPGMLIVEVEGGIWSGGRHSRGGKEFEQDCLKYNTATLMGYRVLRYSTAMVESGQAINDVLKLLPKAGEDANEKR